MKRLARSFSQIFMLIFVSFILSKTSNTIKTQHNHNSNPLILLASAQEYSTIEERIYFAETFIDQDGREKGREYARVESFTLPPAPPLQHHQQSYQQQHQQPLVNHQAQINNLPYHHQQVQSQQNNQPPVAISSSAVQNQDQNYDHHPFHPVQQQADHQQPNSIISSSSHHQQQLVESLQQQVPLGRAQTSETQQQQNNRQYHFAHTHVEWRRESTDGNEMSEFYMHNYQETAASPYHHDQQLQSGFVEDQVAYIHKYHHHQRNSQFEQQQQTNHYQQQQQQQQQQLVNNFHHPHHHQQQQFMYARHTSDESDFEAAQRYYHSSRPVYATEHGLSCESIDDSSILILRSHFNEHTCKAASSDPAAAAAQAADSFNSHGPSRNSNVESYPLAPHHYHYESSLMAAIRHYWREVSGLCLATAIFLNWLFVVVKRKFIAASALVQSKTESVGELLAPHQSSAGTTKDTNTNSAHDSAFEENVTPLSQDDVDTQSSTSSSLPETKLSIHRQRSSTLKAESTCCLSSGHASLSQSTSISTTILNNSEYISRYSSDFDSIQRLGRGGFGIVFEARNKIDDCHYAVKRICLPLEKEARERVMREVRALAKLDHAGIVRYYNAWLETPPDEWLKQHDAQLGILHHRDGLSFPSTDGIYDRGESEVQEKTGKARGSLAESGDQSSDWFETNNNKSNLRQHRTNGYNSSKYLRCNSSSPSLDIVFEGSGSIRLEAENTTKQSGKLKSNDKNINGDNNNSDSEDSDFIQFESKGSGGRGNALNHLKNDEDASSGDETSISANHLTEPFSSSDSGSSNGKKQHELAATPLGEARKKALSYQKELRQLQNGDNNITSSGLHSEKVYLYIQMQLCRKDTLKDWLRTNCDNRDKTTIFDLFYQIVDAVEYVHSQDLIHRDLKPSNIFFSLDGTLKIGDFGLCRAKTNAGVGSSLDLQEYVAESEVERGFDAVHTEQVGTQLYMSPEQLNGLSYNQKVDIFAMGLILLELLVPFRTQMQRVNVLFKARNNLYSEEFKRDHSKEYELVKSLLSRSPQKRPAATEIKQHDLLANAQLSQPVIERIYHRRRTISSNSSTE